MYFQKNRVQQLVISLFLLLNTTGGIKNGQTCYFEGAADSLENSFQDAAGVEGRICCSDGTIIRDVYVAKVSATGTPPHLMFSNYIGAYYPAQPDTHMPGAARRYIFFKGEPMEKKKNF